MFWQSATGTVRTPALLPTGFEPVICGACGQSVIRAILLPIVSLESLCCEVSGDMRGVGNGCRTDLWQLCQDWCHLLLLTSAAVFVPALCVHCTDAGETSDLDVWYLVQCIEHTLVVQPRYPMWQALISTLSSRNGQKCECFKMLTCVQV